MFSFTLLNRQEHNAFAGKPAINHGYHGWLKKSLLDSYLNGKTRLEMTCFPSLISRGYISGDKRLTNSIFSGDRRLTNDGDLTNSDVASNYELASQSNLEFKNHKMRNAKKNMTVEFSWVWPSINGHVERLTNLANKDTAQATKMWNWINMLE